MTLQEQHFKDWHGQYRDRLLTSMTAVVKDKSKAEDITASALAYAWGTREQFRGEASLNTWIYRIALTRAYERLRERPTLSLDAVTDGGLREPEEPRHFTEDLEHRETLERLQQALRAVPQKYRQPLLDHVLRGCSMKEVSRRHRIPLGTASSRIFKAAQLLRAAWKNAVVKVGR